MSSQCVLVTCHYRDCLSTILCSCSPGTKKKLSKQQSWVHKCRYNTIQYNNRKFEHSNQFYCHELAWKAFSNYMYYVIMDYMQHKNKKYWIEHLPQNCHKRCNSGKSSSGKIKLNSGWTGINTSTILQNTIYSELPYPFIFGQNINKSHPNKQMGTEVTTMSAKWSKKPKITSASKSKLFVYIDLWQLMKPVYIQPW